MGARFQAERDGICSRDCSELFRRWRTLISSPGHAASRGLLVARNCLSAAAGTFSWLGWTHSNATAKLGVRNASCVRRLVARFEPAALGVLFPTLFTSIQYSPLAPLHLFYAFQTSTDPNVTPIVH